MCGICGILNFENNDFVNQETLKRMSAAMRHRGPDEDGYYTRKNTGLAHKRLSIIDLKSGRQPIFNEDETCCIAFNGEIYNFKELRESLINRGHTLKTASDTEVIVHAYEEYGAECVKYLRGMFCFAVADFAKNTLFLARDRLGKKPVYYYYDDKRFIFASEAKSIFKSGMVKPEVNREFIDEFMSLGYVTAPHTLFKRINKLPAGSYLIIKDNEIIIKEYWFLNQHRVTDLPLEDYKSRLSALLKEAVKYRMISDVPLGAFLSGGIDSSIIVGLMSGLSSQPVKTFSVGYEGLDDFSELKYAKEVARHFNTDHREIILSPVNFYDAIAGMAWHLDEPISDQACIPLWLMAKESKKYVTVLLSGEGSDELLAGYPIYALMRGIESYRKIPKLFRSAFTDPLIPKIFGERKGQKYLEWVNLPLEKRYLGDMADLSTWIRAKLYSKDLLNGALSSPASERIKTHYDAVREFDPLSRMQYLDVKTWLVDDLLLKADKMTMAASVELRCPFLDHELVEFTRAIPSKFKLKAGVTKYILKETFKDFLPKGIAYRKKRGFPVPLSSWFRGNLNTLISEVLLDTKSLARGYFNSSFIREIVDKQRNKTEDYSKLLWSLLVLEFWHKVFIDSGANYG
ncbi:asparagine synthase (glutamine-hydrolyzing) [bacterium]|nr:MAG: asparagine synthase (glutamine-hydrolyzing) [bacterium]